MTSAELSEILISDEKYSSSEIKQIIYQLKIDTLGLMNKSLDQYENNELQRSKDKALGDYNYYRGESNASQVCLDLLEHLGLHNTKET